MDDLIGDCFHRGQSFSADLDEVVDRRAKFGVLPNGVEGQCEHPEP
jgi:hypothetical protein